MQYKIISKYQAQPWANSWVLSKGATECQTNYCANFWVHQSDSTNYIWNIPDTSNVIPFRSTANLVLLKLRSKFSSKFDTIWCVSACLIHYLTEDLIHYHAVVAALHLSFLSVGSTRVASAKCKCFTPIPIVFWISLTSVCWVQLASPKNSLVTYHTRLLAHYCLHFAGCTWSALMLSFWCTQSICIFAVWLCPCGFYYNYVFTSKLNIPSKACWSPETCLNSEE